MRRRPNPTAIKPKTGRTVANKVSSVFMPVIEAHSRRQRNNKKRE
jgi:hypothetical protein